MLQTAVPWPRSPRILSEHLAPVPEPLACLLQAGEENPPAAVAGLGARALLDLAEGAPRDWPPWLAPHQVPAAERLAAIIDRYGGALLADAVGLGKSYVALALAVTERAPFTLVVPAVLVPQWRALLARHGAEARLITHEALSASTVRLSDSPTVRLFVVDEAHRFRNPETNRYRALAKLVVGSRVLLVTATPVHNRLADLFHLFRLFLRDHDLTAVGVPSLRRAATGTMDGRLLAAAAARLSVARTRQRVQSGYATGPVSISFPTRAEGEIIRAGPTPEPQLRQLVAAVRQLDAGGEAAALFRLVLLHRLASSLAAFRASLSRYEAFLDLALEAAAEGRALTRQEFRRLFPPAEADDLQLALFPLLLKPGAEGESWQDRDAVRRLRDLTLVGDDPKADALERVLADREGKTIVFVTARATVRDLLRQLRSRRVAAVMGETGCFGGDRATRSEVLRAFAPVAQGAPPPAGALETDVLIATDLLSEGLNLQDATRVIHYDLPWSPARLAQRVGRIDRLGSPHGRIETITFLPPPMLEQALALEQRLADKARTQAAAGAAQIESPTGPEPEPGGLDWCDRLQQLQHAFPPAVRAGSFATVVGDQNAVVLMVRIGALAEALVVTDTEVLADPDRATHLLELAARAEPRGANRAALERAIQRAAPLVRARIGAVADARWRSDDRDRLSRRLIPWVLAAAGRAARRGDAPELARLDTLVSRLGRGMTTGEELLLEDLLARREPLSIRDLLAWHERLPPAGGSEDPPRAHLVAAVVIVADHSP